MTEFLLRKVSLKNKSSIQRKFPFKVFYVAPSAFKDAAFRHLRAYILIEGVDPFSLREVNEEGVTVESFHGKTRQSESITINCAKGPVKPLKEIIEIGRDHAIAVPLKAELKKDHDGVYKPRPVYMTNGQTRRAIQRGLYSHQASFSKHLFGMKIVVDGKASAPCGMCSNALNKCANWHHCEIGSTECLKNIFFAKKFCASEKAKAGDEVLGRENIETNIPENFPQFESTNCLS